MRMLMLMLIGLAVSMWTAPSTAAEDTRSAGFMLPHCKAGLDPATRDALGGGCLGIVGTLSFVSRVLDQGLQFCQPSAISPEQLLGTVIDFVETHPERMQEDFRLLALTAMHDAWPCRE
jgi:Rap1a immunity proteins